MSDDYFIGVHDGEVQRLHDQNAAWLPESRALWLRAGFEHARRIADLGSGPGFTTFDLATLVDPGGTVTAIDKAAPYLRFVETEAKRRNLANVRTIECDIASGAFAEREFDAAFCRFFLAFLIDDLDAALAHIRASLERGATFAAMEYLTLTSATCAPPSPSFDAHTRAWIDYYAAHGGDTTVGAVLPDKLRAAGFDVIAVDCVGGIARAGSRWWTWWGRLMSDFGETLVAAGHMSEAERIELERDWTRASSDALAFIHTPVLVQIVARTR
jgi:SAM-dependent methyltransferase